MDYDKLQGEARLNDGRRPRLARFRCFDFELWLDPTDAILGPIVTVGLYEDHIVPVFLEAIRPGAWVLDIGANIGVYSVAAARAGAEVLAIDASPENCKLIDLNARHNSVTITVLPVAVSDSTGMTVFQRTSESNKTIRGETFDAGTFDKFDAAPAFPIDFLIGEQRFDVVKIDIEGREHAALRGAERLWAQRPIFFVEYSAAFQINSGVEGIELLRLFTDRGYRATHLNLRGPNVDLGSNPEVIDAVYRQEFAAGLNVIDLMFTP